MSGFQASDTMPKIGLVTDLREQWLVRTDGALAHRLQDHEISSHLCENRYRNQQIREDFPVALNEQRGIEYENRMKELARWRQAERDSEIAREMAEINLRRQRRLQSSDLLHQPSSSRVAPCPQPEPPPAPPKPIKIDGLDLEELGLSPAELEDLRKRMEQEERDARLARQLSNEVHDRDALLADMRFAVEAQDGELARLLQEREYKKLQRAKEKAKQKALLKKQQRQASLQNNPLPEPPAPQTTLCDAYSNPRDMIRDNGLRLCKSVDSDLNYVEPFEKEKIQSKASAIQSKELSKQYYQHSEAGPSNIQHSSPPKPFDSETNSNNHSMHRTPPPPPSTGKKPRFPDPVSIRPASRYPLDNSIPVEENPVINIPHSYSENNNLYSSTFPMDTVSSQFSERQDNSKRLSVISEITADGLAKKKNKDLKKKKGCKIQ